MKRAAVPFLAVVLAVLVAASAPAGSKDPVTGDSYDRLIAAPGHGAAATTGPRAARDRRIRRRRAVGSRLPHRRRRRRLIPRAPVSSVRRARSPGTPIERLFKTAVVHAGLAGAIDVAISWGVDGIANQGPMERQRKRPSW